MPDNDEPTYPGDPSPPSADAPAAASKANRQPYCLIYVNADGDLCSSVHAELSGVADALRRVTEEYKDSNYRPEVVIIHGTHMKPQVSADTDSISLELQDSEANKVTLATVPLHQILEQHPIFSGVFFR